MPADPHLKPAASPPAVASSLAESHAAGFSKAQQNFEASGDGRAFTLARSALVDSVVTELYRQYVSAKPSGPQNFCLLALGGYGRRELFPYSDIDLLFLSEDDESGEAQREAVAAMARTLWDLRLRVGSSSRTLDECGVLRRDNLEFPIALLDCRYLAGDARLFTRLRDRAIPRLLARDAKDLVRDIAEMTRQRHARSGNTIFHLEPNLKEAPGGLRDYHVARWLAQISQMEKTSRGAAPEDSWPSELRGDATQAFDFLSAARCFVHLRQGRDDNLLTYELQDEAAARGVGLSHGARVAPARWMQTYFRHARSIDRLTAQLLDDARPARASLYAIFQDWKSRASNADFSVVRGRIYPRQPAAVFDDPGLLLALFELLARHGLEPSREAERWVEQSLARVPAHHTVPGVAERLPRLPELWTRFRQILVLPHAAEALRAMHRLGLLDALFPEFRAIDSLVVRDFFHRYTVDEHSFMTIEHLKALGAAENPWERSLAEVLTEIERPELLFLALLFHDVGKGMPGDNHIARSLEALDGVMARLELEAEEREAVRFLVAQHLEMSATLQRRDIFDPETVRAFAGRVGTTERLKMLCLLTYADIKAVNPEALTPWKGEMLWQLYVAASNFFTRSVDEERLHAAREEAGQVDQVLRSVSPAATRQEFSAFLEGFPRRYLASRSPEEIAGHFARARQLARSPVQVSLRTRDHSFELTVLTADRPYLFASITGTLAAWGMNIVKAEAFANAAGTILDTFRFVDLFRTLELNPSETARFKQSVVDVLTGKADLRKLLSGRISPRTAQRVKVKISTQVRFDDASSSHSTLLELITQDRPGLLYEVSSTLADLGCNIEVALIDTEGQKVIDVFYLTRGGKKLGVAEQQAVRDALLEKLGQAVSG